MIDKQTVEQMLERKRRALRRLTADEVRLGNHIDTITRATKAAEINGAIDALEELLHDAEMAEAVKREGE